MAEALDWQSEQVGDKLIGALLKALHSWLDNHGLITRLSQDRLHQHLASALDFVGEKVDGYLMARFLEDNRSWPANQELCAILATTATLRERVIKQLQRELDGKGAGEPPMVNDNGFYPANTPFEFRGHEYVILWSEMTPSGYARYWVRQRADGQDYTISRDAANEAVQRYYERQQAVDEDISF